MFDIKYNDYKYIKTRASLKIKNDLCIEIKKIRSNIK